MNEAETTPVWSVLLDNGHGGLEKRGLILSLVSEHTSGLSAAAAKVAIIGDSLTASTNGTSGNRESTTRTVLQSIGLQNSNISWYGRNNKTMTTTDGNGKTVAQNITEARTALGSVNCWVIALGTNNTSGSPAPLSDADYATAIRGVLDLIYTSSSVHDRVLWVNLAVYDPSGYRSQHYNPIIASTINDYPYASVVDWYGRIHGPRDNADWSSPGGSDDVHLSTAGYAKRDQFIANHVAAFFV